MGVATREAYGQALVELGKKNPNVVALDADLAKSTFSAKFQKEFPDRFFTCGIAEANMVGIAGGLALAGKLPFASSFAVFLCDKGRSEEHTSELQSLTNTVCGLMIEKKKKSG